MQELSGEFRVGVIWAGLKLTVVIQEPLITLCCLSFLSSFPLRERERVLTVIPLAVFINMNTCGPNNKHFDFTWGKHLLQCVHLGLSRGWLRVRVSVRPSLQWVLCHSGDSWSFHWLASLPTCLPGWGLCLVLCCYQSVWIMCLQIICELICLCPSFNVYLSVSLFVDLNLPSFCYCYVYVCLRLTIWLSVAMWICVQTIMYAVMYVCLSVFILTICLVILYLQPSLIPA